MDFGLTLTHQEGTHAQETSKFSKERTRSTQDLDPGAKSVRLTTAPLFKNLPMKQEKLNWLTLFRHFLNKNEKKRKRKRHSLDIGLGKLLHQGPIGPLN